LLPWVLLVEPAFAANFAAGNVDEKGNSLDFFNLLVAIIGIATTAVYLCNENFVEAAFGTFDKERSGNNRVAFGGGTTTWTTEYPAGSLSSRSTGLLSEGTAVPRASVAFPLDSSLHSVSTHEIDDLLFIMESEVSKNSGLPSSASQVSPAESGQQLSQPLLTSLDLADESGSRGS